MTNHGVDEKAFHRLLARVFRTHGKIVFGRLSRYGITPGQPRILHYLLAHDGCVQRDLAAANDLEPATVTNILSIMERSGLIRRESAPEDRRVLRVHITQKGKRAFERAEGAFVSVEKICFRGFAAGEKQQTMQLLGRIYDNLKH